MHNSDNRQLNKLIAAPAPVHQPERIAYTAVISTVRLVSPE